MLEGLLRLFSPRPVDKVLRDIVDIIIVAYVVYRALLVLRGTRAMQMGLGLGIVFLVYLGAKLLGLTTLLNMLSWLLSSIILIVVVVFQNDIRRALIRVGGKAWLSGGREQQSRVIDEVVAAATELARHRMGAIIAFEQDANILEFVKSEGIHIDSMVTRELLVSLFVPESVNKLHDGAVLIRDLKIARAGVFFPMPETKILDASLGSRHRAALGITEETDAVVVVVSEERGTISFCFSGNIVSNLDGQSLRHALLGLFGRSSRKRRFARKGVPGRSTTPSPAPRATTAPASIHEVGGAGKGAPARPSVAAAEKTLVSATLKPAAPAGKMSTSTPMRPAEARGGAAIDSERPSLDKGRPAVVDMPAGATPRPAAGADAGADADPGSDPEPSPAQRDGAEPRPKEEGAEARPAKDSAPATKRTFVPTESGQGAADAKGSADES
jgi:uncharacterized protein (TIGR00159 family)